MTSRDVRFILSTEPLNTAKFESVVHSFESARAFTGDHRDAVAIKVDELPVGAFEKLADHLHGSWIRGDKADDFIRSALTTGRIKEWQPNNADVLTAAYFINPRTLVLHDEGNLTTAELVYVNLKTQMVYYISFKFSGYAVDCHWWVQALMVAASKRATVSLMNLVANQAPTYE